MFNMRTEHEVKKRLTEEFNSLSSELLEGIVNVEKTRDDSEMEDNLRKCSDINERIMALRWVLGEVSEL